MEEEVAEEKYKTLEVSESCRWGWQQLRGATLESTALSSSLPDQSMQTAAGLVPPLPHALCSSLPEHLASGVGGFCENPDLLEAVEGSHSFECLSPGVGGAGPLGADTTLIHFHKALHPLCT